MRMNIFQVDVHNPKLLRNNHPILMLFHQLIPKCISEIFSTFKLGHNLYKSHLLNLLSDFYKHLHINIWSSRSKLFKIWKQEHNIKKDDFKNYYKMHKNNNSTDNDPLRNNIPRKQRKPVTIFNHLNSNNTSSPIDDWIIWVSSNYLDNRPWHNTTFTFHPTIQIVPSMNYQDYITAALQKSCNAIETLNITLFSPGFVTFSNIFF